MSDVEPILVSVCSKGVNVLISTQHAMSFVY